MSKKIELPDKELLEELYLGKQQTLSSIAVVFNVSVMTVGAWLHKHKIRRRPETVSVFHELRATDFSTAHKNLVAGSILGTGELKITRSGKTAVFVESRPEPERMYLEWKKNLLKPFAGADLERGTDGEYILKTMPHPYLGTIWKRFYGERDTKLVPKDVDEFINPLTMGVWICDSGALTWNSIERVYKIDIDMRGYTYEECVILCRAISGRFHLKTSVDVSECAENGPIVRLLGMEQLHWLCCEMKKFVPKCMHYKFDTHM
jgi:hypothetical protein